MGIQYEYIHNDFRCGVGASAWRAIVAALGVPEAQALPTLEDPIWEAAEAPERLRRSPVVTRTEDGEALTIGTIFELAGPPER